MESLMNADDFFFSAEDDALAEKIAAFLPKTVRLLMPPTWRMWQSAILSRNV